ncbi:hypothetical protein CP97_14728 [Aurantiacibacter atlanticus]|uniref:Uncharacterized protein n=1 Tax=Aurantiacibacter atlanticus TaxID=1648404 RepID=A0A161IGA8_9SPHN|nr:hypothetical protein CP97_14728 [Aurantiacibacter atlanticus]
MGLIRRLPETRRSMMDQEPAPEIPAVVLEMAVVVVISVLEHSLLG